MKTDFLKDLNEAQQLAVKHTEGPVMVIAGAGSGKTRVLTYRVAYLIAKGIDPFRILALTFTNKAAREMKERIIHLVGAKEARNVWMGTFHAVFSRVLRAEAEKLGYPSNFTIYDTDDAKSLIRSITRELNLDKQVYPPGLILGRISAAKTSMISPQQYNADTDITTQDRLAGRPRTGEIYAVYAHRCKKAGAMDFDDLLCNTLILLENFPDVLYRYQHKFNHILVDEYQDTNHVQYLILKKLAANNENICVVGDDAQSIYAFRGANIQNILNFKRDYPDQVTYKLEQNYRSTQTIVQAANGVIACNLDQIRKTIWTDNEEGPRIRLLRASSDTEEGLLVANSIFGIKMNQQEPHSAFAILYRTNAQSRSLEEALRRLNIPYRIYGGLSFYSRKEVKDVLAYFRLCLNNRDEEAFKRVINYPQRGIGPTTLDKIIVEAAQRGLSLWEVCENLGHNPLGINGPTRQRIADFMTMILRFGVEARQKDAFTAARLIIQYAGILKDLQEDISLEGLGRSENVEELLNAIQDFSTREREGMDQVDETTGEILEMRSLQEFMQEVSLITDADTQDKDKENGDYVSLMTIHAAKGLEFPHVHIVGLEENLFPNIQSLNSRAELEEERRLFYVALTRARKSVSLSWAETRFRWGNLTFCEPSRFIEEIDEKFLDLPRKASVPPPGMDGIPSPLPNKLHIEKKNLRKISSLNQAPPGGSTETDLISMGSEVEHEKFGKGKVVAIEGSGPNRKATVFFPGTGNKQLLLKFARLKLL